MILNHAANTGKIAVQKPVAIEGKFKAQLRDKIIYKEYSIQNAAKKTIDNIKYALLDPQTYYNRPFEKTKIILEQEATSLTELGKSFNLQLDQKIILGESSLLRIRATPLYQDRLIANLLRGHRITYEDPNDFDVT